MTPPPLPVITDPLGFRMFAHDNGRFSAAVMINGVQVYARDYRAYVQDKPVRSDFLEPDDSEFIQAMNWRK